jgi:hypothetical protein
MSKKRSPLRLPLRGGKPPPTPPKGERKSAMLMRMPEIRKVTDLERRRMEDRERRKP